MGLLSTRESASKLEVLDVLLPGWMDFLLEEILSRLEKLDGEQVLWHYEFEHKIWKLPTLRLRFGFRVKHVRQVAEWLLGKGDA